MSQSHGERQKSITYYLIGPLPEKNSTQNESEY
jgi:hypothetical protein